MRTFVLLACTVLGLSSFSAGNLSAAEPKAGAKSAAPFVHVVVFTVKKDAPANTAEELIKDAHGMLAKIPSVRELRCGPPAEKGTPNLAKKDYQVALVIFFDDYDGLMAYDKHELHVKYVEKHLKNLDLQKLAVYDFLQKK